MKTNRDLCQSLAAASERYKADSPSLEHYLRATLTLGARLKDRTELTLAEFNHVLTQSFTKTPCPYDPVWADSYKALAKDDEDEGYAGWYSQIVRQIVDLHEMRDAGRLDNEYRWLGIDSPRGNRWFNFDPASYLECALAQMFSGRECMDREGEAELEVIHSVLWDDFKWFLYWGQSYE